MPWMDARSQPEKTSSAVTHELPLAEEMVLKRLKGPEPASVGGRMCSIHPETANNELVC